MHQRVPMSLLDITAAASVQMFKHASVQSDLLLSIFNSVKKKEIFIRCGPNHERMIYSFANIIKHFIYQKNEFEPFASAKYFENIAMNPIPSCIHCGLFEKIQKSMCWCALCNFLRFAWIQMRLNIKQRKVFRRAHKLTMKSLKVFRRAHKLTMKSLKVFGRAHKLTMKSRQSKFHFGSNYRN